MCTFGCAGSKVPGDYSSLQTAIDALAAVGQDATICIGNATLSESQLFVRDQGNHNKTLTIIGESIDHSTILSDVYVQTGWKNITFKGVHFSVSPTHTAVRASLGTGNKLTIVASKLEGQSCLDISQPQDVLVDGVEFATSNGYGVSAFVTFGQANVRVENSYFRGTGYSVRGATNGGALALQFVGNTIVGAGQGVDFSGSTTALVANSLFTGTTGFAMTWTNTATVTRTNNALWNNATNYGGLAADGPNTLKIDCKLDMAPRIPSLMSGSPCLNAGDASVASSHDFHGATRGSPPDLGAVESP
jgi:hypothetical protein